MKQWICQIKAQFGWTVHHGFITQKNCTDCRKTCHCANLLQLVVRWYEVTEISIGKSCSCASRLVKFLSQQNEVVLHLQVEVQQWHRARSDPDGHRCGQKRNKVRGRWGWCWQSNLTNIGCHCYCELFGSQLFDLPRWGARWNFGIHEKNMEWLRFTKFEGH